MSLKLQAVADAKRIVEDPGAFSWLVVVTNPEGLTATLQGLTNDIAQNIDPQTGLVVSARKASVTLSLESLAAAGLGMPKVVPEKTSKPWVVQFTDPRGQLHTFKVCDVLPDQSVEVVVCKLEAYKPILAPTPGP